MTRALDDQTITGAPALREFPEAIAGFPSSPFSGFGSLAQQNDVLPFNFSSGTTLESGLVVNLSPNVNGFSPPSAVSMTSTFESAQHSIGIPDAQQLANLPEHQLNDIANNVTQALALVKQKKLQGSSKPAEEQQITDATNLDKVGKRSQGKLPMLKCEYPGCNTTLLRKRDLRRHVRSKHNDSPGFVCPIIDCPMGDGHAMKRSDKLRDHLRGKAVSSSTWRCVIPGCSETAVNKSRWFDHIAQHDQETRRVNGTILSHYGFSEFYGGYLYLKYLCKQPGCPFGTNTSTAMDKHLLIPHNGPYCPCPGLDCPIVCKTWEAVDQHLVVGHTRSAFSTSYLWNQGFSFTWRFVCPIPSCLHICKSSYHDTTIQNRARHHCQQHSFEDLLANARLLADAWRSSIGDCFLWIKGVQRDESAPTNNQIFATLAFPDTLLQRVTTLADLEGLCIEKGINLQ